MPRIKSKKKRSRSVQIIEAQASDDVVVVGGGRRGSGRKGDGGGGGNKRISTKSKGGDGKIKLARVARAKAAGVADEAANSPPDEEDVADRGERSVIGGPRSKGGRSKRDELTYIPRDVQGPRESFGSTFQIQTTADSFE